MRCPRTSPTIRPERSALRDVKLNCRLARGLVLLLELRGAVAPRDATELDHPPTVLHLLSESLAAGCSLAEPHPLAHQAEPTPAGAGFASPIARPSHCLCSNKSGLGRWFSHVHAPGLRGNL